MVLALALNIIQSILGAIQTVISIYIITNHSQGESCFKTESLRQAYFVYVIIYAYLSLPLFYFICVTCLACINKEGSSLRRCCIWVCGCYVASFSLFSMILGLFDLTECFWKLGYNLRNIVKFALDILVVLFTLGVNLATIISSTHSTGSCESIRNAAITSTVLAVISVIMSLFYFCYFTRYSPSSARKIKLSGKHERFMRASEVGSTVCPRRAACLSTDIEHIVRCHDTLRIPARTCNHWYRVTGRKDFMIGFHKTSYDSALLIAGSDFKSGSQGRFGGGIYFARCIEQTERKALSDQNKPQAYFCTLVDMGRKRFITSDDRRNSLITLASLNAEGYDSVFAQKNGNFSQTGDEMVVYENSRVKQWILVFPDDHSSTKYIRSHSTTGSSKI